MERTGRILRKSIHTFLKNYQFFTTTSLLLALPFSLAILLSQALVPFSLLLPTIHNRLRSLFDAADFPPSSEFFTILNLKLSQTITSSILVLPFTLSFLLMSKATIIHSLNHHKPSLNPSFSSFVSIFNPMLFTQVCNFFIILSANATCFFLLCIAFNFLEGLGYSSPKTLLFVSAFGGVLYSIVLANALIACNLALVSSGMERCGGYIAILKACVLLRGKTSTALVLAIPVNMALGAVEALFQYRVVRAYYTNRSPTCSMALEGIFIAYLYSMVIVIDTIVSCVLFKSCKSDFQLDQERRYCYRIEIDDQDVKTLEDLP
ncbi:L-arabinose transport system permease protein like [Actinidia chinensis var. chinensis]|uniref:L-arabinose transport system permease protein like n=1 Tax=Actinidia chinensis var. chinensis TaxID=1590841 RepID=A0A2R6QH44_ACTCC|nr:L-arabinose transport system permease protein like [Actinidia chinensis var. chinensis]